MTNPLTLSERDYSDFLETIDRVTDNNLVTKASVYVKAFMKEKKPGRIRFNTFQRAKVVVRA
jgi:hypothetical protein